MLRPNIQKISPTALSTMTDVAGKVSATVDFFLFLFCTTWNFPTSFIYKPGS
jgi:hypothetical protein